MLAPGSYPHYESLTGSFMGSMDEAAAEEAKTNLQPRMRS